MTGAAAVGAFETVLDLACRGAQGKKPGNQAQDREVADGVWSEFADRDVRRVDGTLLKYNHDLNTAIDVSEMLGHVEGKGQCTAWAGLPVSTLGVHGVESVQSRVDPKQGFNRFRVKLMPAQGSSGPYTIGTTGQGFTFHQVVLIGCYADAVYDPSYGALVEKGSAQDRKIAYEDTVCTAHVLYNDWTRQIDDVKLHSNFIGGAQDLMW